MICPYCGKHITPYARDTVFDNKTQKRFCCAYCLSAWNKEHEKQSQKRHRADKERREQKPIYRWME